MRALLALVGLILLAAPSGAQEVENSTVSGTLVSRSATIPRGETSAPVFSVPSGASFIMTQACTSTPSVVFISLPIPSATLVGSELGIVPLSPGCTLFAPGIAFAADEQISCRLSVTNTVDFTCLVTGVLQSDEPGRHVPPGFR